MTGASVDTIAPPLFDETADHWVRLVLPYEKPPKALRGNSRNAHWGSRSTDTRQVRGDVLTLARQAGLHRLERPAVHVAAILQWAPGDNRRRDEDNLSHFLKAICDAIARGPRPDWIGLDVVPDDTAKWMSKRAIIVPPPAKGMWLDLSIRFAGAS